MHRCRHTPVPIRWSGCRTVSAISMGDNDHSAALCSDGLVWTWGWNHFGQLGDSPNTDRYMPVPIKWSG